MTDDELMNRAMAIAHENLVLGSEGKLGRQIATALADVRRETLEEAATAAEQWHPTSGATVTQTAQDGIAAAIRQLHDEGA